MAHDPFHLELVRVVVLHDWPRRVRGEHDATLRFYRTHKNSQTLVKEITVPLGVLEWLTTKEND